MIGIRADANEVVATGHIMRCITIAKQLKNLGEEVIFFLADDYGVSMLKENEMPYIVLDNDWENPLTELPALCKRVKAHAIHTILFDSYKMTKEYFVALRKQVGQDIRFAYMDDLFEDVYPVDVIINYNAYHTQFPYKEAYAGKTSLCLGPAYVPLREEFGKSNLSEGEADTVLLSCGGGDSLQSLYGILEKAVVEDRFAETTFHVIMGRYHQKREVLERLSAEHKNVVLHHDVHHMAELMEGNQIAVSAAGTMLYELCAMERPTVFFITADNQRYDSDFFAENQRMLFAGDIRENREQCIKQILEGMNTLLHNLDMRRCMKDRLRQVTDGKGAERIAKVLVK